MKKSKKSKPEPEPKPLTVERACAYEVDGDLYDTAEEANAALLRKIIYNSFKESQNLDDVPFYRSYGTYSGGIRDVTDYISNNWDKIKGLYEDGKV